MSWQWTAVRLLHDFFGLVRPNTAAGRTAKIQSSPVRGFRTDGLDYVEHWTHAAWKGRYMDRCGRENAPPCSLADIKPKCSEAKWTDASKWVKAQLARTSNANTGLATSKSRTRPWLKRIRSSLRVLPTQDAPRPHGTIPAVYYEKARR